MIAVFEFEQTPNRSVDNGNAITIDASQHRERRLGLARRALRAAGPHRRPAGLPKAQYVLIHRVYDRSDFSALNIGTGETLPLWGGS